MAKGAGDTRGSSWRNKQENTKDVDNYIKAFTAKGGSDYSNFAKYDTPENLAKTEKYINSANKIDGETVYRGAYMLSGDIENNIFGKWEEGKTILTGDEIGTNSPFLSFSKDGDRVFSYTDSEPKPNPNYDRFENEAIRVRYSIKTTGKNFVDISKKSHYPEEKETIANRKTSKFKFMSAEYKGFYWDIKLQEI